MAGNIKFDTLVEQTLREIYCEMVTVPTTGMQSTELTTTEQDAVDSAAHKVLANDPSNIPSAEEKRLTDLAKRRNAQLQQALPTATRKLQTVTSQPIVPPQR